MRIETFLCLFVTFFHGGFTAAKFTIRNFYNLSSQNCKPKNFLKSSSILTLMSLNSAFNHVSLLHSDNYIERPNIQNKENFKLLKNNNLMMLSAISADEYKQNKQLAGFLCSICEVLSYRVREPVKINKRWNLIQPPEPSKAENLKIDAKNSPKAYQRKV